MYWVCVPWMKPTSGARACGVFAVAYADALESSYAPTFGGLRGEQVGFDRRNSYGVDSKAASLNCATTSASFVDSARSV